MTENTTFTVDFEAIRKLAQQRLIELENPGRVDNWTYIQGGAESGATWKRNFESYASLGFNQVTIHDVDLEKIDLSCDFFGAKLNLPIGVGPMSSGINFVSEKPFADIAKACAQVGIAASAGYPNGMEITRQMLAETKNSFRIFKPLKNVDKLIEGVQAAEEAGCLLTGVDTDAIAALKPSGDAPHFQEIGRPLSVSELKRVRESVKIPFIIKGVLSEQDVRSALEIGADGIVVSTHAGFAMDYCPAPLEVLSCLKKSAGGMKIMVDSGVKRGTDILKALCLGADAVLIGRLVIWGLLIGGADGLVWVLKLLKDEMERNMALLGVDSIKELGPQHLVPLNEMGKAILGK